MSTQCVELIGVPGIPLIETGDDLPTIVTQAIRRASLVLVDNDVVVVTSKIVAKAEGRWVNLAHVEPDDEARRIAEQCQKDPREVMVIMSEAERVSRLRPGV